MGNRRSIHYVVKVLVIIGLMIGGFILLPWWGVFVLGLFLLSFTPGYIILPSIILLDVVSLPFVFPYASLTFLLAMFAAHLLKRRLFDNDRIGI